MSTNAILMTGGDTTVAIAEGESAVQLLSPIIFYVSPFAVSVFILSEK
jgi:type IV secretory pathway TrbD component